MQYVLLEDRNDTQPNTGTWNGSTIRDGCEEACTANPVCSSYTFVLNNAGTACYLQNVPIETVLAAFWSGGEGAKTYQKTFPSSNSQQGNPLILILIVFFGLYLIKQNAFGLRDYLQTFWRNG